MKVIAGRLVAASTLRRAVSARVFVLSGLIAALVAACDEKPFSRVITLSYVGFPEWVEPCTRPVEGLTPEQLTRTEFEQLISGGKMRYPQRINCVVGSFSRPALDDFARKGDPLAKLAIVYADLGQDPKFCDKYKRYLPLLEQAYGAPAAAYTKARAVADGEVISRAPEAAMIAGDILLECEHSMDAANSRYAESYRLGYEAISPSLEVTPVDPRS